MPLCRCRCQRCLASPDSAVGIASVLGLTSARCLENARQALGEWPHPQSTFANVAAFVWRAFTFRLWQFDSANQAVVPHSCTHMVARPHVAARFQKWHTQSMCSLLLSARGRATLCIDQRSPTYGPIATQRQSSKHLAVFRQICDFARNQGQHFQKTCLTSSVVLALHMSAYSLAASSGKATGLLSLNNKCFFFFVTWLL